VESVFEFDQAAGALAAVRRRAAGSKLSTNAHFWGDVFVSFGLRVPAGSFDSLTNPENKLFPMGSGTVTMRAISTRTCILGFDLRKEDGLCVF